MESAGHLQRFSGALLRFKKLRRGLSSFGLFFLLVGYTAAGGKIFQALEHTNEIQVYSELKAELQKQRSEFIRFVVNSSDPLEQSLESHLKSYEEGLQRALGSGISLRDVEPPYRWNYIQAVFFASTVLTTIGYGNMAPLTLSGRLFCIFFALIGIPMTLTVIAELGKPFATLVTQLLKRVIPTSRAAAFQSKSETIGGKVLIIVAAISILGLYTAVGGALFSNWENWEFFEAFYFCFITMTTIGFGDLVPVRTEYMLLCTMYIMVGLALTSTIIELVRRQYAQSWARMKELSLRLQDLSGPLAETLKRLGEQGNVDSNLLKELKDLRKAINMTRGQEDASSDVFYLTVMYEDPPLPPFHWLQGVRPWGQLFHLWKDIPFIDGPS